MKFLFSILCFFLLIPQEAFANTNIAVDLAPLSEDRKKIYQDLIHETISPCEETETLAICLEKEVNDCLDCIADARTMVRLLEHQKTPSPEKTAWVLRKINLARKKPPIEIDLSEIPMRGNPDAPVTVIEFADFQCDFCGRVEPRLQNIFSRYPDRVRFYFINLPLAKLHPFAEPAARAAIAAGKQGKFWEYHDLLYERQESFASDVFVPWAKELGLDIEKFQNDMESEETKETLEKDLEIAKTLRVNSTPTIYINGKLYEDTNIEASLEDAITYAYAKETGQYSVFFQDPSRRVRAKERTLYSYLLRILQFVLEVLFLFLFLFLGLAGRLGHFWKKRFSGPWKISFFYILSFTLLMSLVFLPLDIFRGWWFSSLYGLSNQTLFAWLLDWLKSLGISLLITPVLGMLFYFAVRRFPRKWWLVVSLAVVPLVVFFITIAPVVFAPLFNEFTPISSGPVREKIENFAQSQEIPLENIYEMNMSRQTSQANAFVTGIGATKRIVLADTLLSTFTPDETLFVTGHEIGHYVLHHIWIGVLLSGIGGFLLLFLLSFFSKRIIKRYQTRLKFSEVANPASYPLLLLIMSVLLFFATPLGAAISRMNEHQADRYALEITEDGNAAATAFEKLGSQNLSDPNPPALLKYWFYTHPTLQERIDFARGFEKEKE